MTRLEMLKWCWENIAHPNNNFTYYDVKDVIGEDYILELKRMEFLLSWIDWETHRSCVQLTVLGKTYCKEIFS